jgi:CheY-like chemotaxis protein
VDVTSGHREGQSLELIFRVQDTGIGILAEKQALIFDAFTRADSSTTREFDGMGAGLAISTSLVKLIGGRISAESEPRRGSTLVFTAKFWAIARGRFDRNSAKPLGESTMTEEKKTKERILIAEDDPVSRRVLETLLKKWGYEVVGANDGLEAARLLESREAPRMAVLDWMMPGLEGVQVCQRIRQDATRPYMYMLLLTLAANAMTWYAASSPAQTTI